MHLEELIDRAFSSNGAIVELGGRYVKEQYQYAMAVGRVLMQSDDGLGVLEAETGVGKGLGYIIPCLLFLSIYDVHEQVIVTTYTRILQKQLLMKDLPFAAKVLQHLGLNVPSYGSRMGRQAFFSIERTQYTVNRLKQKYSSKHAYVEQLDTFLQFAIDSAETGSGLWLDWLDEYYVFPDYVNSRDICMLYSGTIDNQAYVNHVNAACDVKFLVTNHATVIGHDNITDFVESAYILIVDEAHHIPHIMTERANKALPVSRLEYLLANTRLLNMEPMVTAEARRLLAAWNDVIRQYDKEHGQSDSFYVSSGGHKVWLEGQIEYVKLFLIALKKIEKHTNEFQLKNQLQAKQVEYIEYLQEAIHALNFWVSANDFFYRSIVFSENERNIGLAVVNPIASRLFAHLCKKLTSRTIITSATLFDSKDSEQTITIVGDLGFSQQEITTSLSVSPSAYGEMLFVLPSREIPVPTSYDREQQRNRFNPIWLDYTAKMIAEASKTGETLVLTYSFEESMLLNERLTDMSIFPITQLKGQKLLECLPNFINGESLILMTPSGWDGLNIRTQQGHQLLKNVIITRLPNSPKNELEEYVAKEYMLSKNIPLHVVENILWQKHIHFCIRTLKQGIGRGLRAPEDKVFVWFADPRMPFYNSPKAKPLINAIPERFLRTYAQAVVYEQDGSFDTSTNEYMELDIIL